MHNFSEYLSKQNIVATAFDNDKEINDLINSILNLAADQNSLVFTIGNGGSASTAEHFSADLTQSQVRTGLPIRSFCLNSQVAASSAFANDFEYSKVLEKQLSQFKNSNYILVAFTASGNSENILNAVTMAVKDNKEVYCFVGFDGGKVREISGTKLLNFPDPNSNYGIAENLHLTAAHYVVESLIYRMKNLS